MEDFQFIFCRENLFSAKSFLQCQICQFYKKIPLLNTLTPFRSYSLGPSYCSCITGLIQMMQDHFEILLARQQGTKRANSSFSVHQSSPIIQGEIRSRRGRETNFFSAMERGCHRTHPLINYHTLKLFVFLYTPQKSILGNGMIHLPK